MKDLYYFIFVVCLFDPCFGQVSINPGQILVTESIDPAMYIYENSSGIVSTSNDGYGITLSFNGQDGIQSRHNSGAGIHVYDNDGYAANFSSPSDRMEAAVRIDHQDNFRVDLEIGGHARISAEDSYVLYMNYNNGSIGNESFQLRNGTNNTNALIVYENGNATFSGVVTAVDHTNSSDSRFKKNISPLNSSLSNIVNINGVRYDWDQEQWPYRAFSDEPQIGFIAQELEEVYPELVYTDEGGYKSVAYNKMTAVLVEAVKELNKKLVKENEELRKENEKINEKLKTLVLLEARISKLENND